MAWKQTKQVYAYTPFKGITNTAQADVALWCWTEQYGIFYFSKTAKIGKDGVVLTECKSYCVYRSSGKILPALTQCLHK